MNVRFLCDFLFLFSNVTFRCEKALKNGESFVPRALARRSKCPPIIPERNHVGGGEGEGEGGRCCARVPLRTVTPLSPPLLAGGRGGKENDDGGRRRRTTTDDDARRTRTEGHDGPW
jgi:hypothetical protein